MLKYSSPTKPEKDFTQDFTNGKNRVDFKMKERLNKYHVTY